MYADSCVAAVAASRAFLRVAGDSGDVVLCMTFSVGTSEEPLPIQGGAEAVNKGLDPARLPPGQYLTEKWPVLHAGTVRRRISRRGLKVFGEVESRYAELRRVAGAAQTEIRSGCA